jgi:hypothetical protein
LYRNDDSPETGRRLKRIVELRLGKERRVRKQAPRARMAVAARAEAREWNKKT